ncbi:hypothetical protein J2755_001016 [Methanohalophilus levihalophilus]|uniref:hypothetical protein n=1 Tax=Methanohalophilus levihalophilus TaxID=1431282 RepID=UPI001AEA1DF1|nr:hypothetical protein [Methanohalophilus levihalophilus]MBP2030082.1 hypothetical protein [Methanohalophilus levihalophilus]
MKPTILVTTILLILTSVAVGAAIEDEPPILYYETDATAGDVFGIQQDYSIDVMDINSNNGDLWIKVSLEGEEVDSGFAKENDPYEYILEIEDEDDEDETKEYLIVKVSFIDMKDDGDDTISEILIEQFLDPERSDSDFLLLGSGTSVAQGEEKDLKNGYAITATDVDTDMTDLILKKDGNIVKTEDELEEGDVFSYTLHGNGEVNTIFMAYVDTLFEGVDSNTVILKDVALREDTGIDAGLNIEISVGDIEAGDTAIISYTLDAPASKVEVFLDGDMIDERKDVDAGTYAAITDELDASIYEVSVKAITEDGLEVEEELAFSVGNTESEEQNTTEEDAPETTDEPRGTPGFGIMISVIALISALMWKRR